MTRGVTDRRGRECGASAVELALILPVLLLLLGAVIDFGRAFSAQVSLTSAAREGARMAALGLTGSVQSRVTSASQPYAATAVVTTGCSATPAATDAAEVTVTAPFSFLILDGVSHLVGGAIPATITLTARGSMRCVG